jgi:hypothetical protein
MDDKPCITCAVCDLLRHGAFGLVQDLKAAKSQWTPTPDDIFERMVRLFFSYIEDHGHPLMTQRPHESALTEDKFTASFLAASRIVSDWYSNGGGEERDGSIR